jgi:SAM-dependent methyltransferase
MTPDPDWWRTFFHGAALEFWDRVAPRAGTERDADFVAERLGVAPGAWLLDIPCGNGRHALALAERGYRVTGVDLAPENLEAARQRAAEARAGCLFEQGDMQTWATAEPFDGAYCLGNSFAYFDDAGNRAFLHAVRRALKPGARFVLDTGLVCECLFPKLVLNAWTQAGDLFVLMRRHYDASASRLTTEYTFLGDGKADVRTASYRVYAVAELRTLFGEVGFTDLQAFGGTDASPFVLGSPSLVLVAHAGERGA